MTIALSGTVQLTNDTSNTTATAITFDSTPADGDLILLAKSGGSTYTWPAGFTELSNVSGGQATAWKIASGEASATYTVTHSSDEFAVGGWVFSKNAGNTWSHVGSQTMSTTTPGTSQTTATVNAGSVAGEFVAIGESGGRGNSGAFNADGSFGGTATGGSDSRDINSNPGASSIDRNMSAYHRIFTASGTVDFTSDTSTSSQPDPYGGILEVFEEVAAGGGPAVVRRNLMTMGVGR